MDGSKLKIVFESLNSQQIRQLSKFVSSPAHNKHEAVMLLFEHLKRQLKKKKRDYSNETLHDVVNPGKAFDPAVIHHNKSYLIRVIEDYLAWSDYKESEGAVDIHLVKAYAQAGLEKAFKQSLTKAEKRLAQIPFQNGRKLRDTFQLKFEEYNFNIRKKGRGTDFKLQSLSDTLEQAFLAEKLKIACGMISHQAVSKRKYDLGLIEPIINYLENHDFLKVPGIGVYYYGWKSLTNPNDDQSAAMLKELVKKSGNAFPQDELRDIYLLAINTCIRQINIGKKEFVSETFDLYQSGLELGVFLEGGELSPWTYKNIAVSGLKLKAYDWVYNFIYDFKSLLPETHREAFFNFNLARYHFEQKEYKEAMPLLAVQDYPDILTNLAAKTMLAKMYFELDEFDALDNLLSALKTFIYRKKVLGYHKENYLKIVNYIQKITRLNSLNRSEKSELISEIMQSTVSEKEWLVEQIGR